MTRSRRGRIDELPDELLVMILERVEWQDKMTSCLYVNKVWNSHCCRMIEKVDASFRAGMVEEVDLDEFPDNVISCVLGFIREDVDMAHCSFVNSRWRRLVTEMLSMPMAVDIDCEGSTRFDVETGLVKATRSKRPITSLSVRGSPFPCLKCLDTVLDAGRETLVHLELSPAYYDTPNVRLADEFLRMLFMCEGLKSLVLANFDITWSKNADGWFQHLTTLKLVTIALDDAQHSRLIGICPRLQQLEVIFCPKLRAPRIVSSSLLQLVFFGIVASPCALEVDAPLLTELVVSSSNVHLCKVSHLKKLHLAGSSGTLCAPDLASVEELIVDYFSGDTILEGVSISTFRLVSGPFLWNSKWDWKRMQPLLSRCKVLEVSQVVLAKMLKAKAVLEMPHLEKLVTNLKHGEKLPPEQLFVALEEQCSQLKDVVVKARKRPKLHQELRRVERKLKTVSLSLEV